MKRPARTRAGIASGIALAVVFALVSLGPFNLAGSRLPDGIYALLASHWRAGEPTGCNFCPDRLFVVICDAETQVHLRGLQKLAALQAELQTDREGRRRKDGDYCSCIAQPGFRLKQQSGSYGHAYDDGDPAFREDVSFRVVAETADAQTVEVRYRDSRTDIEDALFRYELRDGKVHPLESWIISRAHRRLSMLAAAAIVVVLLMSWTVFFGTVAIRRFLDSRRGKRTSG